MAEHGPDGLRYEDLTTGGFGHDASGGVDGLAEQVAVFVDDFARIQTDADTDVVLGRTRAVILVEAALDADRAVNGRARRSEGDHEAVARGLHFVAAVLSNLSAHELALPLQEGMRRVVAAARPEIG